jgi:hypothetical protein
MRSTCFIIWVHSLLCHEQFLNGGKKLSIWIRFQLEHVLHRTEIYISVCPPPYHEGTQGEQIHGSTHRADTNQDSPPVKRFSVDFQLHIWSKSILWFRHHVMKRTIKHLYHTHAYNVWKYKFHVGMSVPTKHIHVTNTGRLKPQHQWHQASISYNLYSIYLFMAYVKTLYVGQMVGRFIKSELERTWKDVQSHYSLTGNHENLQPVLRCSAPGVFCQLTELINSLSQASYACNLQQTNHPATN